MGCFSWMYADNENKNIEINGDKFTLLFPDGRRWTDHNYDGYGHIINPDNNLEVDVYALLAIWNRNLIVKNMTKEHAIEFLFTTFSEEVRDEFFNLNIPDSHFIEKIENGDGAYNETIRLAGIKLAFNDNLNILDDYKPLKFVQNSSLSYNDVDASLDDPNQGGIMDDYDDEDDYYDEDYDDESDDDEDCYYDED